MGDLALSPAPATVTSFLLFSASRWLAAFFAPERKGAKHQEAHRHGHMAVKPPPPLPLPLPHSHTPTNLKHHTIHCRNVAPHHNQGKPTRSQSPRAAQQAAPTNVLGDGVVGQRGGEDGGGAAVHLPSHADLALGSAHTIVQTQRGSATFRHTRKRCGGPRPPHALQTPPTFVERPTKGREAEVEEANYGHSCHSCCTSQGHGGAQGRHPPSPGLPPAGAGCQRRPRRQGCGSRC